MLSDLRFALRQLVKSPGFSLVAALILALGVGANTAVFSVVNAALLRWDEAFADPGRLVMLWKSVGLGRQPTTPADYRDWSERTRGFAAIGAYFYTGFRLRGLDGAEQVLGAAVTASLFPTLGVRPLLGRGLVAQDEEWGRHRVVLLSHGLWQRRFGGRPLLGQALTLDGQPYSVVGIMPPGAWFANTRAALWVPYAFAPDDPTNSRTSHFVSVVGRLQPGVELPQARADLERVARELAQEHPENRGSGADVTLLRHEVLGPSQRTLLVLMAAVGFVLLIACANLANLLLVRAAGRVREVAVRLSLGATPGRLARQLLTESVLLGLVGGLLGVVLALWTIGLATGALPAGIPRVHEVPIRADVRVLSFALLISLATGVLFGLAPALQASRPDLVDTLKEGTRGTGMGRRGGLLRRSLVVAETALAVVLLAGAGLMIRSVSRMRQADLGVRPDHLLTLQIAADTRNREPDRFDRFAERMLAEVGRLPGVTAAGLTSHLPLDGGGQGRLFTVDGRARAAGLGEVPIVSLRMESPGSLQALGVTLRQGRGFTEADEHGAQRVALINQSLARRHFPGENPIGASINLTWPEYLVPPGTEVPPVGYPRWTIVGVVGDVQYRTLGATPEAVAYILSAQRDRSTMGWVPTYLLVRTAGDPLALAAPIRQLLRRLDPDTPVALVQTMEEHLNGALRQPRFTMLLLGLFAAVAMTLAAVGLYGVMASVVTGRTREIGIRLALGGGPRDVLLSVLSDGLRLAALGLGIGLAAALGLTRVMRAMLYEVGVTDPVTFLAVSLVLAGVGLLACYVPARRATRVDPVEALRAE